MTHLTVNDTINSKWHTRNSKWHNSTANDTNLSVNDTIDNKENFEWNHSKWHTSYFKSTVNDTNRCFYNHILSSLPYVLYDIENEVLDLKPDCLANLYDG